MNTKVKRLRRARSKHVRDVNTARGYSTVALGRLGFGHWLTPMPATRQAMLNRYITRTFDVVSA